MGKKTAEQQQGNQKGASRDASRTDVTAWKVDATYAEDRQFVIALARGVQILRCFTATRRELGSRELAALTGLPQSTVWRLCYTLIELGCLAPCQGSDKLRVSAGIMGLGQAALESADVIGNVTREMQDFADATKTAISLCVKEGMEMRILARAHSSGALLFNFAAGHRLPIVSSAAGWAAVAVMTSAEREKFAKKLAKHSDSKWEKIWHAALRSVESFDQDGFIVNRGEFHPEMCGVAIPFFVNGDVYALTIGAALNDLTDSRIQSEVAPRLLRLAEVARSLMQHQQAM